MSRKKKPTPKQLIVAINKRDISLIRNLLADNVDPNIVKDFTSSGNVSMLSYAAGCQFLEGVELLLESGSDPNITEQPGVTGEGQGGTALHRAIMGDDIRIAEDDEEKRLKITDLLLKHGADPNAIRNKDELPLYHAARRGYFEICKRLIGGGAYVKDLPEGCMPPLFGAAYSYYSSELNNYEKIVNLLIDCGVTIDAETRWGGTALMAAAFRGSEYLINLFLDSGANPNRQTRNDGRTPLICVASYYNNDALDEERQQLTLRIVRRLLEAGADPNVRNSKGETAYDMVSRNKNPLVADYIRKFCSNKD